MLYDCFVCIRYSVIDSRDLKQQWVILLMVPRVVIHHKVQDNQDIQ